MIPNITHSTGSGRYLGYDLGTKKDRYQKVCFLAYEGVIVDETIIDQLNQNWEDGDEEGFQRFRKVAMQLSNDLDKQFRAQAALNDRPKIKAVNISLSYSPNDTDKVDQIVFDETYGDYVKLRLKMLREFLNEMGYLNSQWVAVEHLGTHCAHDHVAINAIRNDGTVINTKYDYVRAQKTAKKIREKYGLSLPDESLQMITPKAKEALTKACNWNEYEQLLKERGIGLVFSDHSKNGRGYGVSYTFGTKVIPGSKLHRSLSYGQVEAALARNLDNRTALEAKQAAQHEQAKAKELRVAYGQMIPTIQGLHKAVNDTFQLYSDTKQAGITVNAQTTQKYGELKQSWNEFRQLDQERQKASTAGALIKGIGGMMMFLNPVAGLLAIVIGKIATDIRLSNIQSEKKALLSRIDGLKSDIDSLQQQKAQIKIEKQERLNDYLQAKDARNEFRAGMDKMKEEIQQLKEQTKPKFTFDFKAARQQAATAAPVAQNPVISTATPARSTVDISSILLSAKDKDSLDLALLAEKVVIEPIKDRFGGVSDFKVTLAAEGRVINASNLVSGDRMRQMVDKWESLTGEQPTYKLEIQRKHQLKLADICAKMDAASPENAPSIPRKISFLPGGEIKVSYYNSGRNEVQDIIVDANGKIMFNGIELDINTGKYKQLPGQRQAPHCSQGESNGEGKGHSRGI